MLSLFNLRYLKWKRNLKLDKIGMPLMSKLSSCNSKIFPINKRRFNSNNKCIVINSNLVISNYNELIRLVIQCALFNIKVKFTLCYKLYNLWSNNNNIVTFEYKKGNNPLLKISNAWDIKKFINSLMPKLCDYKLSAKIHPSIPFNNTPNILMLIENKLGYQL